MRRDWVRLALWAVIPITLGMLPWAALYLVVYAVARFLT